jgi:hypothetical protein
VSSENGPSRSWNTPGSNPSQADPFVRAHQESVLFHVVGAKDSFLQEINAAYGRHLKPWEIDEKSLARKLEEIGVQCQALSRLVELENDEQSWLAQTIALRNQGTHRYHINRSYHEGDEHDGLAFFINPRTGQEIPVKMDLFLTDGIREMTQLIEELRQTLPVKT